MRKNFVVFAALFLVACKSIPIEEKIIRQESVNKKAVDLVNKSNLTPEEKTFIGRALTDSLDMAKTENKEKQKVAKENAGLKKYFWIVWSAIGFAGLGLFLKFKGKIFKLFGFG
jgi:hypothetical protein